MEEHKSVSVNVGPCGEQSYDIMAGIVLLLHSLLNGKEETGECRKTIYGVNAVGSFLMSSLSIYDITALYCGICLFSEYLTKVLHAKYQQLTVPVPYAFRRDSESPKNLTDVFVDVHMQTKQTVAKTFNYLDLKEDMETRVQSNDAISIADIFGNPASKANKMTAPKKVLLEGQPGIGKTTVAQHIASQWSRGELWPHITYAFLVKLKDKSSPKHCSLGELLLAPLIPDERHEACIKVITECPEKTLVIFDGYDEGQWQERGHGDSREKSGLSALIENIINNDTLPGAQVLVCSRPTEHLPMKAFNHVVQLCGFTDNRVREYVQKVSGNKEKATFIIECLDENPNLRELCHNPQQCGLMYAYLADRCDCAEKVEGPTVNTTTSLYKQATIQLASKLHPRLKYSNKKTDISSLFNIIKGPLMKHANLARRGMLSESPKFVYLQEDLKTCGFNATDKNCGFLEESLTQDQRLEGETQPCWSFSHTTFQEFFAALGLLKAYDRGRWKCLRKDTLAVHLKTVVKFMAGLLGDKRHEYFVERLLSEDGQQKSQQLTTSSRGQMLKAITDVIKKLNDDAMIMAAVFETQNCDMVHVVPTKIDTTDMSVMDQRALVWLLRNEHYTIESLR